MKSLLLILVGLLPAGFRDQFGADVEHQIERDLERAAARGQGSAWLFTLLTALDLSRVAIVERLHPTWARARAESRDAKGDGMMTEWIRDLYFSARSLSRAPGFVATAVMTLAVAIGVNAAIFSVVQKVLFDPLPFPDPARLVYIAASAPGSDFPEEFGVSAEFYFDYAEQTDLLESVATYNWFTNSFRVDDRVERVGVSMPTVSLFNTLGVQPLLGRLPVEEDEQDVAVLSHAAWLDWFAGEEDVLGRSYQIAGGMRTIIGVMSPDFAFPSSEVSVWIPNGLRSEGVTPGRFGMNLVARVAPGVEIAVLEERLGAVARRLPEKWGGSARYAQLMEQHRAVVRPLQEELVGFVTAPLWVLLGAVAVVFLIAVANVTNLFLVRAERRRHDLAVRSAIGAGWRQLARLQMAEAIVIASLSGALAIAIAWVVLPLLVRGAPPEIPRLGEVALGLPALGLTLGICVLTALVCGLPPAVRAMRGQTAGLREGTRGSTRRRHRGRDALVLLQTSLALVLLVGSGLLLRSFQELRAVDPGYDIDDVFTFQIAVEDEPGLDDAVSFARFHLSFMERLRALPGVSSVGLVENVPLNESVGTVPFVTEEMASEEDAGAQIGRTWAAGDYFSTMGISVLRGRTFEDVEQLENPGSVVISQAAADLLWPGEDPIGRRLMWPSFGTWETVVGVVEDVMQYTFRDEVQPMVYFPLVGQDPEAWAFSSPAFVIKTERADEIAPEVRATVREVAPTAPMYRVFTMETLADDSMVQLSVTMIALGVASVMAMLLGTIGLYGVLSYVVAERTREIGLRMALGARAERVRRMVVFQGLRVVALGIAIGVVVSLAATRSLQSLLFGVGAVDPTTVVVVATAMMTVGALASYLPARRASSVDPVESLRAG